MWTMLYGFANLYHRKAERPSRSTSAVLASGRTRLIQHLVTAAYWLLLLLLCRNEAHGFVPSPLPWRPIRTSSISRITSLGQRRLRSTSFLALGARNDTDDDDDDDPPILSTASQNAATVAPQMFSSGYSTNANLLEALKEAVTMAAKGLAPDYNRKSVDLCIVSVSSLYDGGPMAPVTVTVPAVVAAAQTHHLEIQHLLGCSVAGVIGSDSAAAVGVGLETTTPATTACRPVELEGQPAVAVTFCVLPDCQLHTFHVSEPDLPNEGLGTPADEWKRAVGLSKVVLDPTEDDPNNNAPPLFWLIPSPAFSTTLDDLIQGLQNYFPGAQLAGGIASTVSSLSRAKLYCYSRARATSSSSDVCFADGCVGVCITGDIALQSLTAQGAKPVGGIYQILKGRDSSIQIIVLDESATEALKAEEGTDVGAEGDDDKPQEENATSNGSKAARAQFYAKAQIPKPVLAEANFLMRTLSDDDQAFMRRQLLVGLEHGGSVGRTASELARLASGQGHRFTVYAVASAGMKDGSVTLPLGRVNIQPGTRLRFFVREPDFARREVAALWTGYQKRQLDAQFLGSKDKSRFTPGCCFLIPTLDRGSKFFQGSKPGYESNTAVRALPGVPCIAGFFSNGVIGNMDGNSSSNEDDSVATINKYIGVQGSASGYFLLGSRSGRTVYSPTQAAAAQAALKQEHQQQAADQAQRGVQRRRVVKAAAVNDERAPRSDDGELILKRREVHSGRSLTVSTVEWSVVEKTAKPSSALEGFMWDKETEVDRFRERVPLANLVSQCRLSVSDPTSPKPRDWAGAVRQAARDSGFAIVPECKRVDPASGSLRRRYDLSKLVRDFTKARVPAMSVNCDAILFGGAINHITEAREASSQAAVEDISSDDDGVVVPPILASDLLLYPYQLYKLLLAGADAVNLVGGALASKDLLYLTKIAASLQLQTLVTVTSEAQLDKLTTALSAGSIDGVILSNRELEDFSFDETGEQVLRLLKSDALARLKEIQGDNLLIMVEGRIGIIESADASGVASSDQYLKELKAAGASGAIVGGGLATPTDLNLLRLQQLQKSATEL